MKPWIALVIFCAAAPALADDSADVKALSEAFVKAWDAGDALAVTAMYDHEARVIWPGEGDEAKGKTAVEALIARTLKMFPKSGLVLKSHETTSLGNGYLLNVGMWDQTVPGPDGKPSVVRVRTTELLKRQAGKLLYVVDHASIGVAPPPGPAQTMAPTTKPSPR